MNRRPAASSEVVRQQMSAQRRENTTPELALRRALFAQGMRFRVHVRIGGTRPDVVLSRAKVAIFVMGDFWHCCPEHGTVPKANAVWWAEKLRGNRLRDERQRKTLEALGWHVEWVWECDDPVRAARRISELWCDRTGRDA